MRIAWITPFCSKSAIGKVSKQIAEGLSASHEVDIWTHQREDLILTNLKVICFDKSTSVEQLGEYDHLIYNFGNYFVYHGAIYELFKKLPGIALLHDQTMHSFFYHHLQLDEHGVSINGGSKEYIMLMRKHYGIIGEQAATRVVEDPSLLGELYDSHFALLSPILEHALGVFTHAEFFKSRLENIFRGPIANAYLPCEVVNRYKDRNDFPLLNTLNGRLLMVATGIVHPIKHIHLIADVLLKNPDIAAKYCLVVIGQYSGEYGERLKTLSEGGLKGTLHMLGYQKDSVMNAALEKADICVNLRYPNSEVCSLSLLEQMSFGKPVIVFDGGIYAEMPDNTVLKISRDSSGYQLENMLRRLMASDSDYKSIGANAKRFIKENCSIQNYCNKLEEFLHTMNASADGPGLIDNVLAGIGFINSELSFNEQNSMHLLESIAAGLSPLCVQGHKSKSRRVLGIWLGFTYKLELRREGIMRFLSFMILNMLKAYSIDCEIWCYAINETEVLESFKQIFEDETLNERVKLVTEANCPSVFGAQSSKSPWEFDSNSGDYLAKLAYMFSEADCFIPAIIYLDNVIETGKPIFVPAHDMFLADNYWDFINSNTIYMPKTKEIQAAAEALARHGAIMFSNSETVRRSQVLKYIRNLREDRSKVVRLPVNIPPNIDKDILPERELRDKYSLHSDYLFYPTRIRPHKNIITLIKAFAVLRKEHRNLLLVLTDDIANYPDLYELVNAENLKNSIKCIGNVSEAELYSLYKYTAAVPVTTLSEGGFPWQALEALFMDAPLVLSGIPIVQEWINYFNIERASIPLFSPLDSIELAKLTESAISNRDETLAVQSDFKQKLLSYTWDEAVKQYYEMFFNNKESNNL